MTKEELQKIPFYFVCSAAWEDEHTLTYESEDGRLGFCDHTPRRKNGDFGRTYRHWRIDNKVYKKKEKFIEALINFNPAVVNINDKPYQNTVARLKHERDSRPKATTVTEITPENAPLLVQKAGVTVRAYAEVEQKFTDLLLAQGASVTSSGKVVEKAAVQRKDGTQPSDGGSTQGGGTQGGGTQGGGTQGGGSEIEP